MDKHLFFICPTDFLETVINSSFDSVNYFVTTLGNSVAFDIRWIEEINKLIESKGITEITFVLADDNKIVGDALNNLNFLQLRGMHGLYEELLKRNPNTKELWTDKSNSTSVISCYLNAKLLELKSYLSNRYIDSIEFNCLLFKRKNKVFSNFDNQLLQIDLVRLN